jgi:hypothetical protein
MQGAENFVQEFLKETVKGKTAFNKDDGSSGKIGSAPRQWYSKPAL